jgi:hypothetical protein
MLIRMQTYGKFTETKNRLEKIRSFKVRRILDYYGERGVEILRESTPVDTGRTADSWKYIITKTREQYSIEWQNSSVDVNGTPIVVLLHFGHATKDGYYIKGLNFINDTIKPVIEDLASAAWKEVIR